MWKIPWMSRAERRRWRSARTVAELAELIGLWLEGTIASWPGYQPRYGPDEETSPWVAVLAAANRAGYLTVSSQPGCREIGFDGQLWEQRAAVEGFVADRTLLVQLINAAERAGLAVVLHDLLDKPGEGGLTVTTRAGEPYTAFGAALGVADMKLIWQGCDRRAVDGVMEAAQVTLVDPEYGPHTRLWEALAQAATRPVPPPGPPPNIVCTACGCTTTAAGVGECGDGCRGIVDPSDSRCQACIDPSVIIDWSKVRDGEENECRLCGAPYFHAGAYCSDGCAEADSYDDASDPALAP